MISLSTVNGIIRDILVCVAWPRARNRLGLKKGMKMRYFLFGLALMAAISMAGTETMARSGLPGQAVVPAGQSTPILTAADAPSTAETASSLAQNPWVVGGAVAGFLAFNAVTGGSLLAPLVGQAASNVLGGAWLGPAALSVAARQVLCRTTTLLAGVTAGAGAGYWLSLQE